MKKTMMLLALGLAFAAAPVQAQLTLKTELQDNSPKFILDKAGKASGICIDIFNLLESKEKIKFVYPAAFVATKAIEANVASAAADVHCGWVRNDAREKIATFGEELFKVSYPGVVRANDKLDFKSVSDLINMESQSTVLGVNGVGSTSSLQKINGLRVDDSAKDAEQALKNLAAGRGRIFIYTSLAINYELKQPENKGKFKLVQLDFEGNKAFNTSGQHMVFSKKVPPETVSKVNAAIVKNRKEIDEIVKKWGG
ncbi:MAG: transporter substrate-binding domain-containing protein [Ideonella sp.]|jgi:polar amino acid transport system substrate-binding protein|nr:transporter substrate-binding domain-containing protein [Ideonella sp.]MBL0148810.1 transporter substrate-binding domain-containing protein [Ideonella sp.]